MENRELDMEDWEFIPNQNSYLDLPLHSPKKELHFNPQTDYFVCPSENSWKDKDEDEPEFKEKDVGEPEFKDDIGAVPEFKVNDNYVDEPEFKDIGVVPDVDMESPKSIVEMNTRFDEKDVKDEEEFEHIEKEVDFKEAETKRKVRCRFGALCSIGVAAATICIFVLGGRQQQQKQQFQSQRIQFQIYGNDKRMKQVAQQAGRLNQALSVAVPATRAHISFGGYYDGV